MKLKYFCTGLILFHLAAASGQAIKPEYPKIGVACPDFTLNDVSFFSKNHVRLSDFAGKWLILDFWNEYCSGCIASFPKTNLLQQQFSANVQFLLVGYTGSKYNKQRNSNETIRKLYEKCRRIEHLKLPIAYDSLLFDQYKITGCPFIIVVDPHGKVKGITYTLTPDNIQDLIAGREPGLPKMDDTIDKTIARYNSREPFLTNNNGGSDTGFLYRSLLSNWNMSIPYEDPVSINNIHDGRYEALRMGVGALYKVAYFGFSTWSSEDSLYDDCWSIPILELKDSSLFKPSYTSAKNLFCYSLSMPAAKANRQTLMAQMQRDLSGYFGYEARIEIKAMPYWKVVSVGDATVKLKAKGDSTFCKIIPNAGLELKNNPLSTFIRVLAADHEGGPPIIDETGITNNVDLKLSCLMTNLSDVKTALNRIGLDLIKGEKEMKVLVIRDPKPEINNN